MSEQSDFIEKEKPLVSILLAVYKTDERYLRECLESILKQTYDHFELLIFDDCPTDTKVEKLIGTYSDSRISYYHQREGKGIANNRNDLMKAAKGLPWTKVVRTLTGNPR